MRYIFQLDVYVGNDTTLIYSSRVLSMIDLISKSCLYERLEVIYEQRSSAERLGECHR